MARALALVSLALLIACAESSLPVEPVELAPVQPELFGDYGAARVSVLTVSSLPR